MSHSSRAGESSDPADVVFRAQRSALWDWASLAIGAGAGLVILIAFSWPGSLIFFVPWMALSIGWCGIAFAYDATLYSNGETHFRSLFRRKVVRLSEVIEICREERSIVVRSRSGTVWLASNKRNTELARQMKTLNPAIDLDLD